MKTRQIQMKGNNWPTWALTALALLGLMGLAYGQGEPLSELAPQRAYTMVAKAPHPVQKRSPGVVPRLITDDGHPGDQAVSTAQLILAVEGGDPRQLAVQVLNERGRVVCRRTFATNPGRMALPVDVSALPEGRYVALITEGNGSRVVRFHR